MKRRFLFFALLVTAGIWFWQQSVLSALQDQEKSLQQTLHRVSAPPPVSSPEILTSVAPKVQPNAKTIARSILEKYLALLPGTGQRADAAQMEALNLQLEILTSQSPEVLQESLDLIRQQKVTPSTARTLRNAVLQALSISDPGTCLRYLENHRDETSFMDGRRMGWLKKWAVQDPAAAQKWYEEMRDTGRLKDIEFMTHMDPGFALNMYLLCGRAASDPGAFDFHELDSLNSKTLFRFAADTPSELKTAEKRALYVQRIWNEVADPKTAEQLLTFATGTWAKRVPFNELKLLTDSLDFSATPLSPEKQKILSLVRASVVKEAVSIPEDGVLTWALQGTTDPAVRAKVIGGVVSGWMLADFNRTGTYVMSLPPGPDRDQAILTLSRGLGDSESSLKWAGTISDPVLRTKTEEKIRKEIADDARRFPAASQAK